MKRISAFVLMSLLAGAAEAPKTVAVPPADAGRGLIRVNDKEIRHYAKGLADGYIVSKDNGQTWESVNTDPSKATWEAAAFTYLPLEKKFLRVEPIKSPIYIADKIDGPWMVATADGKLIPEAEAEGVKLFIPGGIRRSPLVIDGGKRIIFPTHDAGNGTWFHYSDDGGKTWPRSKGNIKVPAFEVKEPHQDHRWRNNGVEASVVELKDGKLWAVLRTSQDQHWQSFSEDKGETWSEPEPSRFFATLTMPTIGRLKDGRLISLWTNHAPLAELPHGNGSTWEDVFTNRDSHHIALSDDDGKTWYSFREIYLNPFRNDNDYGRKGGSDIGSHQSEFIDLGKGKVLVALGQHPIQRKIIIVDTEWAAETKRSWTAKDGLTDWTTHSFEPFRKGHCAYDRQQTAEMARIKGKEGLHIRFVDEVKLTNPNEKVQADYRKGGATWNFPNAIKGQLKMSLCLPKDSVGIELSLADRLFNACDVHAPAQSIYTMHLSLDDKSTIKGIKADTPFELTLRWAGKEAGDECIILLDGKEVKRIKAHNSSPNGVSYVHAITAGEGDGAYILEAHANVAGAKKASGDKKKKKK